MTRWAPGARRQLQDAALELFTQQGYAATRVADIAARAGLTERTFFRHFADKREVLFAQDQQLLAALLDGVAAAPAQAGAVAAAEAGTRALAAALQPQRALLRRRQQVIESDEELRERDAAKQARWIVALTARLSERGHPPTEAALAAEVVGACLRIAYRQWLNDRAAASLQTRLSELVDRLPTLVERADEPR